MSSEKTERVSAAPSHSVSRLLCHTVIPKNEVKAGADLYGMGVSDISSIGSAHAQRELGFSWRFQGL